MKIAIGSDHAGYEYKTFLKKKLEGWGHKKKSNLVSSSAELQME